MTFAELLQDCFLLARRFAAGKRVWIETERTDTGAWEVRARVQSRDGNQPYNVGIEAADNPETALYALRAGMLNGLRIRADKDLDLVAQLGTK